MDGHAVPLWLPGLPVPALLLHPAKGGLLQLVPGDDHEREGQHQRHQPLNLRASPAEIHTSISDSVPIPKITIAVLQDSQKPHQPGRPSPLDWAEWGGKKSNPFQCLFLSTSIWKRYSRASSFFYPVEHSPQPRVGEGGGRMSAH